MSLPRVRRTVQVIPWSSSCFWKRRTVSRVLGFRGLSSTL